MFVMQWQVDQARRNARQKNRRTLIGRKVCYLFLHTTETNTECLGGMFGYILKATNNAAYRSKTVTIAFDAPNGDCYVTQENLQIRIDTLQFAPDTEALTVIEAANYDKIAERSLPFYRVDPIQNDRRKRHYP